MQSNWDGPTTHFFASARSWESYPAGQRTQRRNRGYLVYLRLLFAPVPGRGGAAQRRDREEVTVTIYPRLYDHSLSPSGPPLPIRYIKQASSYMAQDRICAQMHLVYSPRACWWLSPLRNPSSRYSAYLLKVPNFTGCKAHPKLCAVPPWSFPAGGV